MKVTVHDGPCSAVESAAERQEAGTRVVRRVVNAKGQINDGQVARLYAVVIDFLPGCSLSVTSRAHRSRWIKVNSSH